MDIPQDTKMQRLLELTEENNKLLKKMHRTQVISNVMRSVYWLILIAITVGAFYFIQPYVDQLKDFYGNISEVTGGVGVPLPGF